MISLKKNEVLKLDVPEFLCDGNLAPHLNHFDILKSFNGYFFSSFIGRSGSGKTSLLISMLAGRKKNKLFRKVFNNDVAVMPTISRQSMKKIFLKNMLQKNYLKN